MRYQAALHPDTFNYTPKLSFRRVRHLLGQYLIVLVGRVPLTKTILNRFCLWILLSLGQVAHFAIAVIRYCPHFFEFARFCSTPLYAKSSRQSATPRGVNIATIGCNTYLYLRT